MSFDQFPRVWRALPLYSYTIVRVLVVSTGEPNDGVFLLYDKIGGSKVPMDVVTGATYYLLVDATNVSGPFGAISSNSLVLPLCDNSLTSLTLER